MRTIPQILLSLPKKPDDGDNPLRLVVTLLSPEMHLRFEDRLKAVPSYSLTEDLLSVIGPLTCPRKSSAAAACCWRRKCIVWRFTTKPASAAGPAGRENPTKPGRDERLFKNPDATAKALKDGWLYTGDLGYLDEDGYLISSTASKMRRGDENISSEEVERVLNCIRWLPSRR